MLLEVKQIGKQIAFATRFLWRSLKGVPQREKKHPEISRYFDDVHDLLGVHFYDWRLLRLKDSKAWGNIPVEDAMSRGTWARWHGWSLDHVLYHVWSQMLIGANTTEKEHHSKNTGSLASALDSLLPCFPIGSLGPQVLNHQEKQFRPTSLIPLHRSQ